MKISLMWKVNWSNDLSMAMLNACWSICLSHFIVLNLFPSNSWCFPELTNIETLQTIKLFPFMLSLTAVCWRAMLANKFTYLKLWVNWERKWKTSEVQNKQLMIGIINWRKENFTVRRNLSINIYNKVKTFSIKKRKERTLCNYKKWIQLNWAFDHQ